MTTKSDVIVATVSMFEPLQGGKGKFTSSVALFDNTEPVSDILLWAYGHASGQEREVIKVEISRNERK